MIRAAIHYTYYTKYSIVYINLYIISIILRSLVYIV